MPTAKFNKTQTVANKDKDVWSAEELAELKKIIARGEKAYHEARALLDKVKTKKALEDIANLKD